MSVTSFPFIASVLALALLYSAVPATIRPWLLLTTSLAYYGSYNWAFVPLLLAVIAATFTAGLILDPSRLSEPRRRPALTAFWIMVIGSPLLFYKYLIAWFESLRLAVIPTSDLDFGGFGAVLIPLGLSFFTFQCVGYVVDVYRGTHPPERQPWRLALFVSFFPQLLAGPIERFQSLSPQLRKVGRPTPEMVLDGLLMFFYGLFLKGAVGDRLGVTVDFLFAEPASLGSAAAAMAFYTFALQLFADFAGYSLIALGAASLFGITLTRNFKQPYFSRNIVEFWQRWHISLTRWIGDYLYRPLGTLMLSYKPLPRFMQEAITILLVWLVMGLWHGATWNFIVFGLTQAVLIIAYSRWSRGRRGKPGIFAQALGMIVTFNIIVFAFGLIRAPDLTAYGQMLHALLSGADGVVQVVDRKITFLVVLAMAAVETVRRFAPRIQLAHGVWPRALAITTLIIMFGLFGNDANRSFIYFRF